MVLIRIPDENRKIDEPKEAAKYLSELGIVYEKWSSEYSVDGSSTQEEILFAYSKEVEDLKKSGGYTTADVINIDERTPGLDDMLNKFNKEHWHSEDEVRFTIAGRGIFHIHPENGPVIAVEVSKGDLLRVPSGTKHWFDLCEDRNIKAIRLFQDKSGWTPYYVHEGVEGQYQPICFGPTYIRH